MDSINIATNVGQQIDWESQASGMGYAYHTVSLGICRIACLFSAAYSLKLLNYPEKKTEEL